MRYLLLITVTLYLAACTPREKLITRGWQFSDIDMGPPKDSADGAFKQMVRNQMVHNLQFTMLSDSEYVIRQLKEGQAIRGKWWFSADKKVLYTRTDLGLTTYNVVKLTKKEMVYVTTDPVAHTTARIICVPKE